MLTEKRYDEFIVQNAPRIDRIELDYNHIDKIVEREAERDWERKTDEEYRQLKERLKQTQDPNELAEIKQRLEELEDATFLASHKVKIKKKADLTNVIDKKRLENALYSYIEHENIDWYDIYGEQAMRNFYEEYSEHRGRAPHSNVMENVNEELADRTSHEWIDLYGDTEVERLMDELSEYKTERELQENHPDVYDYYIKQLIGASFKVVMKKANQDFVDKLDEIIVEEIQNKRATGSVVDFYAVKTKLKSLRKRLPNSAKAYLDMGLSVLKQSEDTGEIIDYSRLLDLLYRAQDIVRERTDYVNANKKVSDKKFTFKKKAEKVKLTNKMMTDMVPMLVEKGEPTDHKCHSCNMRYKDKDGVERCTVVEGKISFDKGTCNYMAAGEEASEEDAVEKKMSYDTAGYVETDKVVQCSTCKYYNSDDKYCKLWEGAIEPEGCCMAWDRDDVTVPKVDKEADYNMPLSDDQMSEVAAKYGPEYNSAVMHYTQARDNNHPHDRALAYAKAETEKEDMHVDTSKILEILDTYLPGKLPMRQEEE